VKRVGAIMNDDDITEALVLRIPPEYAGQRLDQVLARLLPDHSRSQIQQWIEAGAVLLDRVPPRQRDKVAGGEVVEIQVPAAPILRWEAEDIPLDIVHEDAEILVLNKPAGMVVHPAVGNYAGTLVNALLQHAPSLAVLPRAGIVHRLDKETSGLLVVAKAERARLDLIEQLRTRTIEREYLAIVTGVLISGGTIDAPIGRHPRERTRMAVTAGGKPAVSHYRIKTRYRAHTLLLVKLESGRTHQIRVHMAHLRHPIVGDPVYGGRAHLPAGASETLKRALKGFKRQALHATRLGLVHPGTGEHVAWTAPPPADMTALMAALAEDVGHAHD
jgi:23S rRNA pseudouridine1911/1915/1917 synthase